MTVILFLICILQITFASPNDRTSFMNYKDKIKTYQLEVPGSDPITIIESKLNENLADKLNLTEVILQKDDIEMKNLMTHIIHDVNGNKPRCYGPSCQEGFVADEGPHGDIEVDTFEDDGSFKNFHDFSNERLQAIAALAAKLKKQKVKPDKFSDTITSQEDESDSKVFTSWNRVKVKQHKHPFDDKDGWVTLEPVAWSTSKISKWKPNIKKNKPVSSFWNDNEENKFSDEDQISTSQDIGNSYTYAQNKPIMTRPGYINNKLHIPDEYDAELPSKPTWTMNKPQPAVHSFQASWSSDESRRPQKPHCDKEEHHGEDTIYYGIADSIVTDPRPANFPYEYEALHQSSLHKRPMRRPTQVVYAGIPEEDGDRSSRPPHGDGQWVLLSTTKGYKTKKRQRSLAVPEDTNNVATITSHQAIGLTVLPAESSVINMTTSHGGLLEVEKSFQTVEESKRDMDLKNDLDTSETHQRPVKRKIFKKKIVRQNKPDSSTVLAAVGAGMVPATMAMVVPMMLGRRRRRDIRPIPSHAYLNRFINNM